MSMRGVHRLLSKAAAAIGPTAAVQKLPHPTDPQDRSASRSGRREQRSSSIDSTHNRTPPRNFATRNEIAKWSRIVKQAGVSS
jgi:hypothetical protein